MNRETIGFTPRPQAPIVTVRYHQTIFGTWVPDAIIEDDLIPAP